MVDAPPSTPGNEERTRRNVACVNCRNSKVRCRTSQEPGQPCQRCGKLDLECVVDKSHRRVTKQSKLEQLEQELRSIKQVVNPDAGGATTAWAPATPRAPHAAPAPTSASELLPLPPPPPPPPQAPTPRSEPPPSTSLGRSTQGSERRAKTGPAEPRLLDGRAVSGDDVDWYFAKYMQCYHAILPVLRHPDPDECYAANPTLFWVVVYVACRRYPRDGTLLSALADHIGSDVWVMVSAPALDLDAIHALLLLCTWPLPDIRFVTDPSSTLAVIALNSAKLLGCHSGRGSHPRFAIGMRQHFRSSDEEASSTWVACCMLAQRTSSSIGIPPPSIQLNDAGPKRALESHVWTDLLAMYEAQRFLNRFYLAMAAQIAANGGVSAAIVATWEAEFDALQPLLVRLDTDVSRFCLLAAQLEIQRHYCIAPPPPRAAAPATAPPPSLRANTMRIFNTSRSLIALSLDLDARIHFLKHASQWVLRSNIDAAAIVIAILHSASAPDMTPADADGLARQACGAVLRCSVRDADLPHRTSVIMGTFWSVRDLVPLVGPAPNGWPDRLGAGVTFWCLESFKLALKAAQGSTERANNALDLMQPARSNAATSADANADSASAPANGPEQVANPGSDFFQDVNWSMFMDDFGWVADDTVLLGLP